MSSYIKDALQPKNFTDYIQDIPEIDFYWARKFPSRKIQGNKLDIFRTQKKRPVRARIHALDAATDVDNREGYSSETQTLGYIKRERLIREEDLDILAAPRSDAEAAMALDNMYSDGLDMRQSCEYTLEYWRAMAVEGELKSTDNNTSIDIKYPIPKDNFVDWQWSSPDKSKLDLLFEICEKLEDNDDGVRPSIMVMRSKQRAALLEDEKIRSALFGVNAAQIPTPQDLNNFLQRQGLPRIDVYNKKFREEDLKTGRIVTKPYLAEDKIILIPDGNLGETIFGTTPEERNAGPNVTVTNNGFFTMQIGKTHDTEGQWIKCSARPTITLEVPNQIAIATVK